MAEKDIESSAARRPVLSQTTRDKGKGAHRWMAVLLAALLVAAVLIVLIWTARHDPGQKTSVAPFQPTTQTAAVPCEDKAASAPCSQTRTRA
ncbi:hypothetical protein [Variovorax sp.]|uniref:hypothetical protein n=1 Tax=Variovorax sp. TaxID=1871043 RepID=UPI002D667EF2|nr:hypothetical protein [Variovorax sp.]HYP85312.1 hypothetical protein [Variovorax sp.]